MNMRRVSLINKKCVYAFIGVILFFLVLLKLYDWGYGYASRHFETSIIQEK